MNDLKPTFEHYYPEESVGGQCTTFLHQLLVFPSADNQHIGDFISQKKLAVDLYGIKLADLHGTFQVGDIVVSKDDPIHGHTYCVNAIVGNQLRATESNYHLDEKVHHTRLVPVSPLIYGVIRNAPLKVAIINQTNMNPNVHIYRNGKEYIVGVGAIGEPGLAQLLVGAGCQDLVKDGKPDFTAIDKLTHVL